jgi:hypothetical protein
MKKAPLWNEEREAGGYGTTVLEWGREYTNQGICPVTEALSRVFGFHSFFVGSTLAAGIRGRHLSKDHFS